MLDIDPRGLEPGGVCGSALALPFRDGTFDVVCAFDVVEHCEPEALALDRAVAGAQAGRAAADLGAGLPVGVDRVRRGERPPPALHPSARRAGRPGGRAGGDPVDVRLRGGLPVLRRRAARPPRPPRADPRRWPARRSRRSACPRCTRGWSGCSCGSPARRRSCSPARPAVRLLGRGGRRQALSAARTVSQADPEDEEPAVAGTARSTSSRRAPRSGCALGRRTASPRRTSRAARGGSPRSGS